MANFINEFKMEILAIAISLIVGIIGLILRIISTQNLIMFLAIVGVAIILFVFIKTIYNTKMIKNPLFLKPVKVLKNVRLYTSDGDKIKLVGIEKIIQYSGTLGFLPSMRTKIYVDEKDLLITPKYITANILILGKNRATTLGEVTINQNAKLKMLNAKDEQYYRDRVDRQISNIEQAELEAKKLTKQNNMNLFEQLITGGAILSIALMLSIVMIALSMDYAKSIYQEASKSATTVSNLADANKLLANSLNTNSQKEYIYIKAIAKELGISVQINETVAQNKKQSGMNKLGTIITNPQSVGSE